MKYMFIGFIELLMLFVAYLISQLFTEKIYNLNSNRLVKGIQFSINNIKLKSMPKGRTTISILTLSVILYLIMFCLFFSITKIFISSLIFSLPFFILPYVAVKIAELREKQKVLNALPIYAMNLKNHLDRENNLVLAMKKTKVEEPISSNVASFVKSIEKGANIYDAFERLKLSLNVKEFSELISAFQVCIKNGGRFSKILEVYSRQISEKIILKEKEREKSISSIITLVVMIGLDLFLLFGFVFQNMEFKNIFRQDLVGRILVDLNAISCIGCLYLLFKIYKMEE